MKRILAVLMLAVVLVLTTGVALAKQPPPGHRGPPPGCKGYERHPGNNACH